MKKLRFTSIFLVFIMCLAVFSSCKKDDSTDSVDLHADAASNSESDESHIIKYVGEEITVSGNILNHTKLKGESVKLTDDISSEVEGFFLDQEIDPADSIPSGNKAAIKISNSVYDIIIKQEGTSTYHAYYESKDICGKLKLSSAQYFKLSELIQSDENFILQGLDTIKISFPDAALQLSYYDPDRDVWATCELTEEEHEKLFSLLNDRIVEITDMFAACDNEIIVEAGSIRITICCDCGEAVYYENDTAIGTFSLTSSEINTLRSIVSE